MWFWIFLQWKFNNIMACICLLFEFLFLMFIFLFFRVMFHLKLIDFFYRENVSNFLCVLLYDFVQKNATQHQIHDSIWNFTANNFCLKIFQPKGVFCEILAKNWILGGENPSRKKSLTEGKWSNQYVVSEAIPENFILFSSPFFSHLPRLFDPWRHIAKRKNTTYGHLKIIPDLFFWTTNQFLVSSQLL